MKSNGMTDEQIKKILPATEKSQGNVFDNVVKEMLASEDAPKREGKKAEKSIGAIEYLLVPREP